MGCQRSLARSVARVEGVPQNWTEGRGTQPLPKPQRAGRKQIPGSPFFPSCSLLLGSPTFLSFPLPSKMTRHCRMWGRPPGHRAGGEKGWRLTSMLPQLECKLKGEGVQQERGGHCLPESLWGLRATKQTNKLIYLGDFNLKFLCGNQINEKKEKVNTNSLFLGLNESHFLLISFLYNNCSFQLPFGNFPLNSLFQNSKMTFSKC